MDLVDALFQDFGLTHTVAPPASKGEAKTMGWPSAASGPSPDRRDFGVAHSGIPTASQGAAKTMGMVAWCSMLGSPHRATPPIAQHLFHNCFPDALCQLGCELTGSCMVI